MAKASDNVKYYKNRNGAVISTVNRKVIEKDGLFFKDIDGTGEVSVVNDWRLPAAERAKAYAEALPLEEKIGQLFISDWRMGKYPVMGRDMSEAVLDESGTLDEGEFHGRTIFGEQHLPGTSTLLKEWFARHLILRANPTPEDLTDYLNQLQAVAEECEHFVPVSVASNSRNEHGEVVYGMNDAAGVFPTWPGTMGIAAAVKGDSIEIVDKFADCIRRTWNGAGLRKGYMYMADVLSDPRWQRSYGTFGEDPELICEIFAHLVPRIQGSKDGVTEDGVAMTVKHFPGGGARENGFDPHYAAGQWNVYQTEGSLEKYHLPAFQVAIDNNAASIMPYYAKPAKEKSAPQMDKNGTPMEMQPYGFAFNKPFIDGLLRKQMGFKGYVNSDTGIVHNMKWGVEMLDEPERIGFAINNAGVDLISGLFDNEFGMEAYQRGKNDYYETHPVPEGFQKEEIILTEEAINRAVARTMTEMFQLGMFENPYRDPAKAAEEAAEKTDWDNAMDAHRKSVTLLKNDGTLPLTAEKLAGKKIYAEAFHKRPEMAERMTKQLREMLAEQLKEQPAAGAQSGLSEEQQAAEKPCKNLEGQLGEMPAGPLSELPEKQLKEQPAAGAQSSLSEAQPAVEKSLQHVTLVEDASQADYAILMLSPSSGEYFNATSGYLELDICDGKEVCNVDDKCRPMAETHLETTLSGVNRIPEIAAVVHANGGKVIANVNFTLAWQLGNVEPYVDALTAGYDTYVSATLDVILGWFCPVGKLPITLPRGDEVLKVNEDGVCISPNDVPGYDKDQYMPDGLKDENGKAYAYRDENGNYYELNFSLTY